MTWLSVIIKWIPQSLVDSFAFNFFVVLLSKHFTKTCPSFACLFFILFCLFAVLFCLSVVFLFICCFFFCFFICCFFVYLLFCFVYLLFGFVYFFQLILLPFGGWLLCAQHTHPPSATTNYYPQTNCGNIRKTFLRALLQWFWRPSSIFSPSMWRRKNFFDRWKPQVCQGGSPTKLVVVGWILGINGSRMLNCFQLLLQFPIRESRAMSQAATDSLAVFFLQRFPAI